MTPDEKADTAIKTMIGTVIGTSVIPAYVNWAATAAAMGTGVVAIGMCYDVKLNKDEAWQLIKQFITAGGLWFAGMILGSRILSMIITSTGIGYFGAVAMDATVSAGLAYAIGESAKAYFKGTRDKKELGRILRSKFKVGKAEYEQKKEQQKA